MLFDSAHPQRYFPTLYYQHYHGVYKHTVGLIHNHSGMSIWVMWIIRLIYYFRSNLFLFKRKKKKTTRQRLFYLLCFIFHICQA